LFFANLSVIFGRRVSKMYKEKERKRLNANEKKKGRNGRTDDEK
jgi:hypothetical protein